MNDKSILILGLIAVMLAINSQALAQDLDTKTIGKLKIVFTRVIPSDTRLEIELEVVNLSNESFFLLIQPRTHKGDTKGLYISQTNDSTLELSSQFHRPSKYFIPVYATGVKLKELLPGSTFLIRESLDFPLHPTLPPFGESASIAEKAIRLENLTTISFQIGVLPFDKGIEGLMVPTKSKPFFDGYLHGSEIIEEGKFKGQEVSKIQSVISATGAVSRK